jgi:hypothetical protein
VKGFADAYFNAGWPKLVSNMQQHPVGFDAESIVDWLRDRPDRDEVVKELDKYLDEGFLTNPISDVNVHLKLESLLKDEPVTHNQALKARIIVWQAKGITAMFSSPFKELKKRLKTLFRTEILYTDGLQPDEINDFLSKVGTFETFMEDDLTKQDSSTDSDTINVEFGIYNLLGARPELLKTWRRVHESWRFKGKNVRGVWQEMRLTGQATTALGNAIVNLSAHWRFVRELQTKLKFMLVLGDDNLVGHDGSFSPGRLRRDIADYYNMKSKAKTNSDVATFCAMVCYKDENNLPRLGPDFVRLRRRYEVPNGVHETNDMNLVMRKMSYCMMLGPLPQVNQLITKYSWPIKPVLWYDPAIILHSLATKYETNDAAISGNLGKLIELLDSDTYYKVTYNTISQN